MSVQFDWETEAIATVNKKYPVKGKIERSAFMLEFQKFISRQVDVGNQLYLKEKNGFPQDWADPKVCPEGVQALVKILKITQANPPKVPEKITKVEITAMNFY
jgi:hypothetical protein